MPQAPPIRRAAQLGLDVELRAIRNGGWRFPSHWHHDLQVIATVSGLGEALVEGQAYALPERSLIVIPPGAVHTAYATSPEGWSFHSLHASPERLSAALPASAILSGSAGSDVLVDLFGRVTDGLFQKAGTPVARFEAFINEIGLRVARDGRTQGPEPLLRARAELGTRLNATLSIAELAARHGFSTGHFSRAFAAAFHMPPYAWRMNARTEAAKRSLRAGATVAEAARDAGFTNLSHFSRHYRNSTGVTARAYAVQYKRTG